MLVKSTMSTNGSFWPLESKRKKSVVFLLDRDSSVMRENNFYVKIECIRDKGLPNFSSNTI